VCWQSFRGPQTSAWCNQIRKEKKKNKLYSLVIIREQLVLLEIFREDRSVVAVTSSHEVQNCRIPFSICNATYGNAYQSAQCPLSDVQQGQQQPKRSVLRHRQRACFDGRGIRQRQLQSTFPFHDRPHAPALRWQTCAGNRRLLCNRHRCE